MVNSNKYYLLLASVACHLSCTTVEKTTTVVPEKHKDMCGTTTIVNMTQTWSERDRESLETAKKGCTKWFGKYSCLIKFTKVEDLKYRATCKKME